MMDSGYCPHIKDLSLGTLQSLFANKRHLVTACLDCANGNGKPRFPTLPSNEVQSSDKVYICLACLHVGCTGGNKGHARTHAQKSGAHFLASTPGGDLHCYKCETDIYKLAEEDEKKVAQFQKILKDLVASQIPKIPEEEEKKVESKVPVIIEESKDGVGTEIDTKNEELYLALLSKAKTYSTMRGLHNLGNTCYFNSMMQCLQATVPLVELFQKADPKSDYFLGENVRRLKDFTLKYHGSTGSLDPSSAFSIICKQKHYFGNYSQQDSYDALLTMLDAIITDQKKALARVTGTTRPITKILDIETPIGKIFGFYLTNKGITSLPSDDSINKRYLEEKILEDHCYVPNKQQIFASTNTSYNGEDVDFCLRKFFESEYITDNVACDECKKLKLKGGTADKEFFIRDPPKILIVLLKRFKSMGYSLSKNSASIKTLEKIYLDDYAVIDRKTIEKLEEVYGKGIEEKIKAATVTGKGLHLFEYRLYGISTHSGSIYGGHYTAHVKHGDKWNYASDSYTHSEGLENALSAEAYVLFYERIW